MIANKDVIKISDIYMKGEKKYIISYSLEHHSICMQTLGGICLSYSLFIGDSDRKTYGNNVQYF